MNEVEAELPPTEKSNEVPAPAPCPKMDPPGCVAGCEAGAWDEPKVKDCDAGAGACEAPKLNMLLSGAAAGAGVAEEANKLAGGFESG